MAKDPVADIVAVIVDGNDDPKFVTIGVLWKSNKGNLSGAIDAEPFQWKDGSVDRAVVIRPRKGVRIRVEVDEKERQKQMAEGPAGEEEGQRQRKTARTPHRTVSYRGSQGGSSSGS